MYLKNTPKTSNANKRVLIIAFHIESSQSIIVKMQVVRISKQLTVGTSQIHTSYAEIEENVPYLNIQIIDLQPEQTILFFSNLTVNVYTNGLIDSNGNKETVSMKTFTHASSKHYVLEYFGQKQTVNCHFEMINDKITLFLDQVELTYANICKIGSAGKIEYVAGSYWNIKDYNQYHIYYKHSRGLVNAYYTNTIDIEGDQKSILPTQALLE